MHKQSKSSLKYYDIKFRIMKKITCALFICATITARSQTHTLEKIWETDTIVAIPESVLPDLKNNVLYISLINGGPWVADGIGGIGKLTPDGKKYDSTWITGLNAPKGMGRLGDKLYVADISEVIVIDIKKGKIEKKIAPDSAKGLNDITVSDKGIVYVSDSRTGKIWRIENNIPALYLDSINGVNGLKAIGDDLFIGAGKNFIKADKNKNIRKVADLPQGIDGIEPVGNGDFILTAWAGYIFYVSANGQVETLLDSHLEKMNTADIGYDAAKKIVYVPTFNAKKIIAYRLQANPNSAAQPKVFIMDAARLAQLKKNVQQNDKATLQLVDELKKQAEKFIKMKTVSVMDKAFTPVSGSKHDYMSQAPYFWYDSTKPKGLPYLRRDGERNPEINRITDKKYLGDLESTTKTLALAYYLTGDEKYAFKAAELIRYWFFNADTKMNPNLKYAQGIPGINNGRGIGIIESRAFTGIADAAGLLEGSNAWKQTDANLLKQWYTSFLNWMLTSKNGNDEHMAKNNHGTWYYVQVIDFALFTGDKAKAKMLAEESIKRLDSQLTKEGKQPLELERTKALGYSTMNLRGWFEAARLADQAGVDLWNYKTSKGADLRTALNWLLPYALNEKEWAYKQIEKYNPSEIYPLLLQAAYKYNDQGYLSKANSIKKENNLMTELLYRK